MKKKSIIGLGNILRQDDGIGIILLEKLIERKKELPKNIELIDGGTSGMNLLHILPRYETIFIIDAVNFGGKVGEIRIFLLNDIINNKEETKLSSHEPNLLKIFELSKRFGELPDNIFIFGIQPKEINFENNLSSDLQQKLELITEELITTINKMMS